MIDLGILPSSTRKEIRSGLKAPISVQIHPPRSWTINVMAPSRLSRRLESLRTNLTCLKLCDLYTMSLIKSFLRHSYHLPSLLKRSLHHLPQLTLKKTFTKLRRSWTPNLFVINYII